MRYSAEENAKITRALLELQALRPQVAKLSTAVGFYMAKDASLTPILDAYVDEKHFLGIGSRKARKRLRSQILKRHAE